MQKLAKQIITNATTKKPQSEKPITYYGA